MSGAQQGGYLVPAGPGAAELVEKRSTFIGRVEPVSSEEEARAFIEQIKKKHYDARHNCWCYLIRGGAVRYSDDGEPQGTAGQPMLSVFQKEGVTNACCVVTRYFGGVLLGAGGLVRAYTQAAKDALTAAGIARVRRWERLTVTCPYSLLDRVKQTCAACGGAVDGVEYAADITVTLQLPLEGTDGFCARMTELSAGGALLARLGEEFRA